MSRPAILFAEDFDHPAPGAEPEIIDPTFTAAELTAAREQSWAEGHAAALREAAEAQDLAQRASAGRLIDQLAALANDLRQEAEQRAEAIAELLLEMLAALFPSLSAAHGEQEALALVRALMPGLARMPNVTIRANPCLIGTLAQEVERADLVDPAAITVVPSESVPAGDVRLIWAEGGASRDAAQAWARVSATLREAGFALPSTDMKELDHAA